VRYLKIDSLREAFYFFLGLGRGEDFKKWKVRKNQSLGLSVDGGIGVASDKFALLSLRNPLFYLRKKIYCCRYASKKHGV